MENDFILCLKAIVECDVNGKFYFLVERVGIFVDSFKDYNLQY